jgi:16S rRNA (cytosine967-C5)-methyltransferase
VNAVLRNFQRQQAELTAKADQQAALATAHPAWFVQALQQAYPEHWQGICQANNEPAALCLRLKPNTHTSAYVAELNDELAASTHPHLKQAVLLNSTDVTQLLGFDEGWFSVQDASAQWAGHLLQPKAHERILDACAAPGGKTTHLLELCDNQCELTALDIEATRLERIQENLTRLQLNATLKVADAADTESWWDGQLFDAILLDAPCSATGIIRRHPDIKWHRKPADIRVLNETQANLLDQLWPLIKPSGRLLYATCSVLPSENKEQIQSFLSRTDDAQLIVTPIPDALDTGFGQQLLPSHSRGGDGFFYALLHKRGN